MACTFCRTEILESNKLWGEHHASLSGLKNSAAEEHCIFCESMLKEVTVTSVEFDRSKALYRWTIRKPGRIRESEYFVILTFRPVVEGLEVRSFCLVPQQDVEPPTKNELGISTGSEEALNQIEKWMRDCQERHPRCRQPGQLSERGSNTTETEKTSGFVPTRLVDIGLDENANIHIVDTRDDNAKSRMQNYCTLSHCWGELNDVTRLTKQNKLKYMDPSNGIPWNDLTKNFQTAIQVARRLQFPYIWIDSLCIIQGEGGDFDIEGQYMHSVYRHSRCNIAAAASKDSMGGLFQDRDPEKTIPVVCAINNRSNILASRRWCILPVTMWEDQLLGENPLYRRAWVFQERMLSPRLIHFSRFQLFWDCVTLSACEILPGGLPKSLDKVAATERHWRERLQHPRNMNRELFGTADDSLETFWRSAVRNYTSCNLKYPEDRLLAIWGIAKLIRDDLDEEYGVGLWQHNLHEQLGWRVLDPKKARRSGRLEGIPSWSWASLDVAVELRSRLDQERTRIVTDHKREPIRFVLKEEPDQMKRENQQPQLESEALAAKGRVFQVRVVRGEASGTWTVKIDGNQLDEKRIEVYPDEDTDYNNTVPQRGEFHFAVVLAVSESAPPILRAGIRDKEEKGQGQVLWTGHGLLLKRVETGDGLRFRRVGAFNFNKFKYEEWQILNKMDCKKMGLGEFQKVGDDAVDFFLV